MFGNQSFRLQGTSAIGGGVGELRNACRLALECVQRFTER